MSFEEAAHRFGLLVIAAWVGWKTRWNPETEQIETEQIVGDARAQGFVREPREAYEFPRV